MAPGFLVDANRRLGSSRITARSHRKMGRRLRWLDGDGLKGGTYRLDRGEVRLVRPRPEERPETRDATRWGAGRRFLFSRLSGAPLPLWREKEMKAAPRAILFPGPMALAHFRG